MTFEIKDSTKNQNEKVEIRIYNSQLDKIIMSKNNYFPQGTYVGVVVITSSAATESSFVPFKNLVDVISDVKQNNVTNINNSIKALLPSNFSVVHSDLVKKFCEIAQFFDSKLNTNDELYIKNWLIQNQPNQPTKNIEIFFYYDGNILMSNPNAVSGDCTVQY